VDDAFVPEVQVQAVGAGTGGPGVKGDSRSGGSRAVARRAVRVDVQVAEIAPAQGDQVAERAQVGPEVGDGAVVPGHGQGEHSA